MATNKNIQILEVLGPSGPQLRVGGPLGLLDFVLRALWALRPCDPNITLRYAVKKNTGLFGNFSQMADPHPPLFWEPLN